MWKPLSFCNIVASLSLIWISDEHREDNRWPRRYSWFIAPLKLGGTDGVVEYSTLFWFLLQISKHLYHQRVRLKLSFHSPQEFLSIFSDSKGSYVPGWPLCKRCFFFWKRSLLKGVIRNRSDDRVQEKIDITQISRYKISHSSKDLFGVT